MNVDATPASVDELAAAVRAHPRVLVVGAGTKPRPAAPGVPGARISTRGLSGIIDYEPDEFTFTALAGTPVATVAAELARQGQYLPFDPLLAGAGATLGGTVAAGVSGPGRFRYGGIRDFILGARFVDGAGRLIRLGGRVVKNAAGFDVPKFLVGSLGRYGALAEITFKVFPRRVEILTLRLPAATPPEWVERLTGVAASRWEVDALDVPPAGDAVWVRLAGPATALPALAEEILRRWPGTVLSPELARDGWNDLVEARWVPAGASWIKVPITPDRVPATASLVASVPAGRLHVSVGGNVAWIALPAGADVERFDRELGALGLAGLTLNGSAPLWLGARRNHAVAAAVRRALDPGGRFPAWED